MNLDCVQISLTYFAGQNLKKTPKMKLFRNNFEIISVFYFTCNHCQWLHMKKHWNNFKIISEFYFTCDHVWNWNKIISAAEGVLILFQNYFSNNEHVGK